MFSKCKFCGNDTDFKGWTLNEYFGITGKVCASCFEVVERDSKGSLKRPKEFLMFQLQYGDLTNDHSG